MEFRRPTGVAVDDSGAIWIADSGNRRIARVENMAGDGWKAFGAPGRPSAEDPADGRFWDPVAIHATGVGQVLVADPGAGRVVRISDISGAEWTTTARGALSAPTSIVPHGTGYLVADFIRGRVVVLDSDLAVLRMTDDVRLAGVSTVADTGSSIRALVPPLRLLVELADDGSTVTVKSEQRLAVLDIDRPVAMEMEVPT